MNPKRIYGLNLYNVAGTFFLVTQLFIFSALLLDPLQRPFLLWSCNNFCFLLAIACFRKDMQLVKGVSYLGLVTQILWISDFASHLIGFDLSGVTDYIRSEGFTYANDVSIVLHTVIPVAVLLFTFRTKPKFRSFVYALPYILFLYFGTLLLTPPIEDINCVFSACAIAEYIPYSIYLWPVYAAISALLSYAIHHALYFGWRYVAKAHR